jgi:hypothetical protein
MTDTTVYNYKIYCNTESTYVSGWGTALPTQCYNNSSHSVNTNSVQLIQTVSTAKVQIDQKIQAVNGRFHVQSIQFTATPNTTTDYTFTFDTTMSLNSFNFMVSAYDTNDCLCIIVSPDTPLGLITQNKSIGDTVINVPSATVAYMNPGLYITLTDGTNTNGPTKILSKDLIANTITIKNALTNNFSSTNTQLLLNYYCLKDLPIASTNLYTFGSEIINSSNVPAGTTTKFRYKNTSLLASKSVVVYLSGLI